MKLEDLIVGRRYMDDKGWNLLYVASHPHDGACLIMEAQIADKPYLMYREASQLVEETTDITPVDSYEPKPKSGRPVIYLKKHKKVV